ncbi:MAG TPA: MFS transporter [Caldilineae bacterium]|nr:MFS transporter [Caldilineae bacterium]
MSLRRAYVPRKSPQLPASGEVIARRRARAWGARSLLISLMVPSFVVLVNRSMIGVALPAIRSAFGAQVDLVAWVVTVYTLPYVTLMPLYGRLGDGLGKRRLFLIGVVIFLVGTLICLMAHDLGLLMVGRAIQGIGAASVVPLSIAIISELFPASERGRALGTWNSVGPATGMVGPLLGGLLVDTVGWQVIFVPVFLVGMAVPVVLRTWVPATQSHARPRFLYTFDWGGVTLLSAMVAALLFYVSSKPITGVAPLRDWRLLVVTLLLLGVFILWEKRRADPFVALDLFAHKAFTQASVCAGIRMFTMSGIGFLMPLYLVDVQGLRGISTGVMLMIHAGALLATMRWGGMLADRWRSRPLVMLGLSTQAIVMMYFALLPGTAPLAMVVLGLIAHGLGAGLALAPLHRAAMSQIPQAQMGVAAGLYSMIRFAGTVLGTALGSVLLQEGLDRGMAVIQAYHAVFWFLAVAAVFGVVIGTRLRE